jgi:hypothetical protein
MMLSMKRLIPLFLIACLGCACPAPKAPSQILDTLYFGGSISQADWDAYLAKEVTPRFPDGLTHWEAKGQWREGTGPLAIEGSQVLQILHASGADADAKLKALIDAYKAQFRQKSVLRVRSGVEAEF